MTSVSCSRNKEVENDPLSGSISSSFGRRRVRLCGCRCHSCRILAILAVWTIVIVSISTTVSTTPVARTILRTTAGGRFGSGGGGGCRRGGWVTLQKQQQQQRIRIPGFVQTSRAAAGPTTRWFRGGGGNFSPQRLAHFSTSTDSNNPSSSLNMDAFSNLPFPIILGSASFTRKLILKELGLPFHIVVRPIDEKGIGNRTTDRPDELVLQLGLAKMKHLVQEIRAGQCHDELPTTNHRTNSHSWDDLIVLTADQVVTCHGQILEKPESVQQAKEFVALYPTHPPSTVGSCVLHHVATGLQVSGVDTATLYFQPHHPALQQQPSSPDTTNIIDALLQDEQPVLSCAGALMVEHPLVQDCLVRMEGTVDSVMGLSKELVLRLLHELSDKVAQHRQPQQQEPQPTDDSTK